MARNKTTDKTSGPTSNGAGAVQRSPGMLPTDSDGQSHPEVDILLETIVTGITPVTGDEFFAALVQQLAQALGTRYAFIAEFAAVKTRVRTLKFWAGMCYLDNFEYDLSGTPCEAVLAGDIRHYANDLQNCFPQDDVLRKLGVVSYLAIPLRDQSDEVVGHLGVMDTVPMTQFGTHAMSLFRIFAARGAAEVQRQRAEAKLHASEQRLAGIIESAMDGIVILDAELHIQLFNATAERLFNLPAPNAIGQPFGRLLPTQMEAQFTREVETLRQQGADNPYRWLPDEFMAQHRDSGSFPIEGTLSWLRLDGQELYTLILRDVSERKRAAQTIQQLSLETRYLQEEIQADHNVGAIVSSSPVMRDVLEQIARVAPTPTSVLITGETGTGKELIARAVHAQSPRLDRPLVRVNCAALSPSLVESELFGHEKGAFTGAETSRMGRFELADGGTLFLDEIGELSPDVQAKLLRVLQEGEFERVGGTTTQHCDVRIIAATNRDLDQEVEASRFRADLYYRLNVFPIRLPPLRERREDIPQLAQYFITQYSRQLGKPIDSVPESAWETLKQAAWPGNIRELANVIERAVILSTGDVLELNPATAPVSHAPAAPDDASPSMLQPLEAVERAHVRAVLEHTSWVIEGERGATTILQLHPNTLRYRMKKLGITRPSARR